MAHSMLNSISIAGYVADELVLQSKDKEGEALTKVSFHLKNPKVVGGKEYYNEFYIVVYGKKARECLEHLSVGSECTVVGSANTWSKFDAEKGVRTSGFTVDAKEVYF